MPVQLQRAMAAEAEAAREARAKVIAAEGEQRASRALKEAAEVINESPAALQVRPFAPMLTHLLMDDRTFENALPGRIALRKTFIDSNQVLSCLKDSLHYIFF